jgi:hypothetical protein
VEIVTRTEREYGVDLVDTMLADGADASLTIAVSQ